MSEQEQHVQTLLALGSDKTEKEIRELLQKHNWNLDAAAGALFDVSTSTAEPSWGQPADPLNSWANESTQQQSETKWDADWSTSSQAGESSRGRSMDRGNSSTVGALNLVGADKSTRESLDGCCKVASDKMIHRLTERGRGYERSNRSYKDRRER